ncbi:hypothetical protein FRX31_011117 [Thalictrum thalictroides]|uniref:Uncharacterized protein n=1 Tax=Thalictrum thalictroides TaxID=46969 RepID=A0A7J6WQR3_THATH|nr:hypothetical protein FRX31_011117 [Thalictrum thalictroides]
MGLNLLTRILSGGCEGSIKAGLNTQIEGKRCLNALTVCFQSISAILTSSSTPRQTPKNHFNKASINKISIRRCRLYRRWRW